VASSRNLFEYRSFFFRLKNQTLTKFFFHDIVRLGFDFDSKQIVEGEDKMKIWRFVLIGLIVFLLPVYVFSQPPVSKAAPSPPSTLGNLRLSLIDGDVQIKTVDTGDWVPTSINMPLREGDELWVPEAGRSEIQLVPATSVRLDQNSALAVMTVKRDSAQFYLTQGRAYLNFNPGRGGMIQLDTPISSTRAYGRAVFRVDVDDQGFTDVSVLDGTVYVESKGGKTTVDGGNMLSLKEETYAELAPLGPADDWENWNMERDKRVLAWRDSSRYLPEELRGYSSDFDNNGKWVYVKEYGQVWTPTVVVSAEWAPYRVGRWTWIGGDYVWISYEPWGWAPYHYGRWAFMASIGWCWVPPVRGAVYWGPGFVGWVHTPTYVAWVPLAPREVYYGYGYYGPHSVNLRTVNINTVRITNVYRNVNIHNSITIVNNNTFIRGWGGRLPHDAPSRYTDTGIRENPFLQHRVHPGRPLIKPERSTMIAIHREISPARLPPPRIREVNPIRLRETRQIVRDRNVSAFRPGVTPRPLTVKPREGAEIRRPVEPRRVIAPGGETRPGGPGPQGIERKVGPGQRPGGPGPRGGIKPEGGRPAGKIEERKLGPGQKPRGPSPGEGGIHRETGPGGPVRKGPGPEGRGGPARKEGPSGKPE
jgi:FecR protein